MGNILADIFGEEINSDILPDGKMYYNIAKRLIEPSLKADHEIISTYTADVQTMLNEQAGISLQGIKAEVNQDRIDNMVDRLADADSYDDIKWILDEPVKNYSQSVVDSTIKANADFNYRAGFQEKVIRKDFGKCCKWCRDLAGTYDYPRGTPKDVWRRHAYCRCTVEHLTKKGRSDVWNKHKKVRDEKLYEEEIRKRKKLSEGNRNESPKEILKILKTYNINEKEIYINAKSGKKHNGIYVDAQNKSKAKLEKSIRSHYKQVEDHSLKIKYPNIFDKNWNKKNDTERKGLLKKWSKDLNRNAEQALIEIEVWRNKFDG